MKASALLTRIVLLLPAAVLITGCAASFDPADSPPLTSPIGEIHGQVYGGRQADVGAEVFLFATGTGAYGGNGIAASTLNASASLLTNPVYSGANGTFSVSGDYTCTVGQQVYLYVLGGNPGAGTNSAAGFLAGLGACPMSGSLAATVPNVFVDEVSTITTAFALAGFATDATHISTSGTTHGASGIANAMSTITNLSNIATGTAYAITPNGNGVVPQKLIYTLANILATCVDSTGPSSTACTTLFNDARSGGGQTGTKATDTATAAIYLAQHPYSAYVGTLFNLQGPVGSPYVPNLGTAPASFAMELLFSGGGLSGENTNLVPDIQDLAVDATGNIWVANNSTPSISKFSPLGVSLAGGSGYSGSGCGFTLSEPTNYAPTVPISIAVANNGLVWVGVTDKTSVCVLTSSGVFTASTTVSGADSYQDGPFGIAFDATGNAWVANDYGVSTDPNNAHGQVYELSGSTYGILQTETGGGIDAPYGIAVQSPASFGAGHTGDIWVSNNTPGGATMGLDTVYTAAGGVESFSPTSGGSSEIQYGGGIAIDAAGYVWTVSDNDPGGVSKTSSSGNSGSFFASANDSFPTGIAIDGAGNAWYLGFQTTASTQAATAIVELNNNGVPVSASTGYVPITDSSGQAPQILGLAIDQSGNVWYTMAESGNSGYAGLRELVGIATPVATPLAYGVASNLLGSRP